MFLPHMPRKSPSVPVNVNCCKAHCCSRLKPKSPSVTCHAHMLPIHSWSTHNRQRRSPQPYGGQPGAHRVLLQSAYPKTSPPSMHAPGWLQHTPSQARQKWGPQSHLESSEMPILDRILSRPYSIAWEEVGAGGKEVRSRRHKGGGNT